MRFKNKILMVGYGSVARCALPILLKHIDVPYKNVTVIDCLDKRNDLKAWIKKGLKFSQEKITPINLAKTLGKHVGPGGLIVDLSWNIDCIDLLTWCHDNKVLYINTSVEEWDPYASIHSRSPFRKSLYYKQMEIRKVVSKWNDGHITAIIDHGANPGLISHFTKRGLIDIAHKIVRDNTTKREEKRAIKRAVHERSFAHLARAIGVKVIHCSERDTQISGKPKEVDEFVGTWSIEGLREEGTAPSELGWGTHEKELPTYAHIPPYGPKNQIFISRMGMNTWVRSWVPNYEIIGMVIRHAEAFSISDHLTVFERGKPVYRPTVHYAYMPCDETIASLHELRARNYEPQPNYRIMNDEIIKGGDMLGSLIMGHKYNSWWTGSMLSIEQSRKIVPHQNATTVQVAAGVVSAAVWMIENPNKGLKVPDDLPHDYILNIAKPYLGNFVSEASDWTPLKNYQIFFKENPLGYLDKKNIWCFQNFLFKH